MKKMTEHLSIIEQKSHPIPITELRNCISNMEKSGGFKKEFKSVSSKQTKSWDYSQRIEHRYKNTYIMAYPYNDTRVILQSINNDPSTDYINANFIDGYKSPQRYIATQAPLSNTINDFWRMIWQIKCHQIVMLTNLEHDDYGYYNKYWPEDSQTYGEINVMLKHNEIFDDFTIRNFTIKNEMDVREVIHYQFSSWPDHSAPKNSNPLLKLINEIHKCKYYKLPVPIVVHCLSGIGRSGAFIVIDSMLQMAKHENKIDILEHFCTIRMQRINMVETLEQYVFVHKALAEALSILE